MLRIAFVAVDRTHVARSVTHSHDAQGLGLAAFARLVTFAPPSRCSFRTLFSYINKKYRRTSFYYSIDSTICATYDRTEVNFRPPTLTVVFLGVHVGMQVLKVGPLFGPGLIDYLPFTGSPEHCMRTADPLKIFTKPPFEQCY
jgi:hypothetical protein